MTVLQGEVPLPRRRPGPGLVGGGLLLQHHAAQGRDAQAGTHAGHGSERTAGEREN